MPAPSLLPLPSSVQETGGSFRLAPDAAVAWRGPDSAAEIAGLLADCLRPATGFALPVREGAGAIELVQSAPDPAPDEAGFLPRSRGRSGIPRNADMTEISDTQYANQKTRAKKRKLKKCPPRRTFFVFELFICLLISQIPVEYQSKMIGRS